MEKSGDEYQVEKTKSQIRVKVEHRFVKIKRQFGCDKVSLSRIEKNTTTGLFIGGHEQPAEGENASVPGF